MGIIYSARNIINGKRYIGQTGKTLEYRRKCHENDARREVVGCTAFYQALRKHGFHSFEWSIIFDGVDDEELDLFEIDAISVYRTIVPFGYNLREGGSRGKHSDATKRIIGNQHRGKTISDETREKLRRSNLGRSCSTKGKTVEEVHGIERAKEIRYKTGNGCRGKIRGRPSDETRKKISEKQKGRPGRIPTAEENEKRSESLKKSHARRKLLKTLNQERN